MTAKPSDRNPTQQSGDPFGEPSTIPVRFGTQISMAAAVGLKHVWDHEPAAATATVAFLERLAARTAVIPDAELPQVLYGAAFGARTMQRLAEANVPAHFDGHGKVARLEIPLLRDRDPRSRLEAPAETGNLLAIYARAGLENLWASNHPAAETAMTEFEVLSYRCESGLPTESLRDVVEGLLDGHVDGIITRLQHVLRAMPVGGDTG